ncbi:MAG TPA: PIG-L family deacetylase [Anaerolineales bacterium]|nr:PIG-L family deacetylase [Anaerolineales bacterium]
MTDSLKLLAVFPHPDDETLGLGSTFARYSAEGVETYLVCATRGERGWFDSEGPNPGLDGVAKIREAELTCAAEHLGLREVNFLDYIDGDVDQSDHKEIIGKIVTQIRRIRPQVVVTFAPDGSYGHPDHIALSQFTMGALVCAADQEYIDSDEQISYTVSKFYYMVDSVEGVRLANEAFGGISMDVDGVTRHHVGWEDWQITTRLDNTRYMDAVQKAIKCHQSQLPGYGPISDWPLDELTKVFGKGYFYRTYSLINGGRKVESDLFEGLR